MNFRVFAANQIAPSFPLQFYFLIPLTRLYPTRVGLYLLALHYHCHFYFIYIFCRFSKVFSLFLHAFLANSWILSSNRHLLFSVAYHVWLWKVSLGGEVQKDEQGSCCQNGCREQCWKEWSVSIMSRCGCWTQWPMRDKMYASSQFKWRQHNSPFFFSKSRKFTPPVFTVRSFKWSQSKRKPIRKGCRWGRCLRRHSRPPLPHPRCSNPCRRLVSAHHSTWKRKTFSYIFYFLPFRFSCWLLACDASIFCFFVPLVLQFIYVCFLVLVSFTTYFLSVRCSENFSHACLYHQVSTTQLSSLFCLVTFYFVFVFNPILQHGFPKSSGSNP